MDVCFGISAAVAIVSTIMTITLRNAIHALLYFIVSLLAIATTLYWQGAVFAAALEVIVYAGAIMVLFLFVVMLLNVRPLTSPSHKAQRPWAFVGPFFLAAVLVAQLVWILKQGSFGEAEYSEIGVHEVAKLMFTDYAFVVELTSFLLLAGLIAAYHIAKKRPSEEKHPHANA